MIRHALLAAFLLASATAAPAADEVTIKPDDPAIHYSGRFDMRDKAAPRCQWPASAITLRFKGTSLSAKFGETGNDYWQVEIDGKPASKVSLAVDRQLYEIASGLPAGERIVKLVKATEGLCGTTQFLGFELGPGSSALPASPVTRRIEVVGDSISCGYGDEAADQHQNFTAGTENAAIAYGALAAEKFGADYACIAFSGRKMWPDNTMPEIYDRTLTTDASLKWDFSLEIPDAVVINLSTNDFGRANPDEAQWIAAYRKFIARLRANYPKALIYCATGSMLADGPDRKPKTAALDYIQKIVAAENAAGDAKVRALDFGQQSPANGFGANWHPSRKTHQLMADKLTEALQADLGWK